MIAYDGPRTLGEIAEWDRRRALRKLDEIDDFGAAAANNDVIPASAEGTDFSAEIESLRAEIERLLASVSSLAHRSARSMTSDQRRASQIVLGKVSRAETLIGELQQRQRIAAESAPMAKANALAKNVGKANAIAQARERLATLRAEARELVKPVEVVQKVSGFFGSGTIRTARPPVNAAQERHRANLLHDISVLEVSLAQLGVSA